MTVRLPWGDEIEVSADDNVGGQIATLGLYDLAVTESLWRLCDPGSQVLDIGANIGYTAFVMAHRIQSGTLRCYEPHPILSQELNRNIASLRRQGCRANIQCFQMALGSISGNLPLSVPKNFLFHRGESSLTAPHHLELSDEPIDVPVQTLDAQLDNGFIDIAKIDVEGYELEVLRGAERTFSEKRVRDCVFEEHHPYPTPVSDWFEAHGYAVFRLDRSFFGPRLLAPNSQRDRTQWTATNFIATLDSERVRNRFSRRGWDCLHRSKRSQGAHA